MQGRDDGTAQKVRVISEQRGAVNARAAGSRCSGDKPDAPAAESRLMPDGRSRDKEQEGQVKA